MNITLIDLRPFSIRFTTNDLSIPLIDLNTKTITIKKSLSTTSQGLTPDTQVFIKKEYNNPINVSYKTI